MIKTVYDCENGLRLMNEYKFPSNLCADDESVDSWLEYCDEYDLLFYPYRSSYLVDYNFYCTFKPVSLTGYYWDYVKCELHPEEVKSMDMLSVASKVGIRDHVLRLRTIDDNIPVLICAPYDGGSTDYNPVPRYTVYELNPNMITYYAFITDGEFDNSGTNYLLVESKYVDYLESDDMVMSFIKPGSKVSF